MNVWSVEFLNSDEEWCEFSADSGILVRFVDARSAKAIAKFVAISDNRFPTNFLHWRIVDSIGNKFSIL
jgi:hypothetical protein